MNRFLKIANSVISVLLRRGFDLGDTVLLTVPGRRSGQPRTTPVTILEWDGQRWLQSPYGKTDWVRNLRAASTAKLTRGRDSEPFTAVEIPPSEAARVYRGTLPSFPLPVRRRFEIEDDAPLEAFEQMARRHPMFRVVGAT